MENNRLCLPVVDRGRSCPLSRQIPVRARHVLVNLYFLLRLQIDIKRSSGISINRTTTLKVNCVTVIAQKRNPRAATSSSHASRVAEEIPPHHWLLRATIVPRYSPVQRDNNPCTRTNVHIRDIARTVFSISHAECVLERVARHF